MKYFSKSIEILFKFCIVFCKLLTSSESTIKNDNYENILYNNSLNDIKLTINSSIFKYFANVSQSTPQSFDFTLFFNNMTHGTDCIVNSEACYQFILKVLICK
jgi:hypothetical protein